MPSLNFVFCNLDTAAMHLSTIVETLAGTGLHKIVYYSGLSYNNRTQNKEFNFTKEVQRFELLT